ncbi:MAG: hypothetical protein P8J33_14580, partial [Pirellulaceae bacterium]|nr:hypothetical protein [Pirellulaceae bacterium]
MPEQNFLSTSEEARTRFPIPAWWWLLIGLALISRMYVVAQDEVVSGEYDSFFYAQIADSYYSVDDPFSILPLHRPGLPILAGAAATFGIPYKLFLDLLLGFAATLAGISFYRLTKSDWLSLLMAILILWNPYFIYQSWVLMTEPLITIILLLLLISSIPFVCRPFSEWSIAMTVMTGIVTAAYLLVRNEMPILLGFYAVLMLLIVVRWRRDFNFEIFKRKRSWKLVLFFLPLLMAWSAERAVKAYHDYRFGVPAMCVTEADGFMDLMNALYSIEPTTYTRFVPVPCQSLELACQHSPVMENRRDFFMDSSRGAFQSANQNLGLQGEVGTWLNWHIIDCFGGVDRNSNHQMRIAARQIRNAQNRGQLKRRNARFPVEPLWGSWLPDLPYEFCESLLHSSSIKFNPTVVEKQTPQHQENSVADGIFNQGLLRRSGAGFSESLFLSMVCRTDETTVTRVSLLTEDQKLISEVPVKKRKDGFSVVNLSLSDMENFDIRQPSYLRLVREDSGERFSNLMKLPRAARLLDCNFQFGNAVETEAQEAWVVSVRRYAPQIGLRETIKVFLKDWRWLAILLLGAAAFVGGLCKPISRQRLQDLGCVVMLGACLVLGRSLFYSLIHVWLAWGAHRYVQPNILVTLFTLSGLCFFLGS